ncbi:MAG: efflux transporter outer membrane subunit [Desulfobulbaceae bacterium]|jgi:NodT family efflux transporter outer membrane factor (OMF) lipoprotein|nr:efflux transporter outer membrane subunit [Desulfobulbaceae bacterium]
MKSFITNICWLSMVLLLGGCSLHADQAQKVTGFAETFAGDYRRGEPASFTTQRWWEMYGDDKLNSLIRRGFSENLDLEMAWARLQQAQALERVAGANKNPDINGSAGTGRSQSMPNSSSYPTHQLSVAASYELDVWQKLANKRQSASLLRLASENDVKALYISLSAEIAEAYYLVLELRAKIDLTVQMIESFDKTVSLVRLRYDRGVAPSLDVYQAKQNLLRIRADLPVLEGDLVAAENSLAILLGFRPGEHDLGLLTGLPEIETTYVAGLPSELLARRPDVEGSFLRLQAMDADIAVAIAARFPSFNLSADYGSSSSSLQHLLQNPNVFWNLLVAVSAPLIDGGSRKADVEHRQARFREQLARYHQTVLRAFGDVEDSLAREQGVDGQYVQLKTYADVTGATLRLSLQRYQQGLDTFLPVLTAQVSHAQALMAVVTVRRKKISSRIQLARALGGRWMAAEMDALRIGERQK